MFATFFHELKAAKVPVTLKEYLTLMEALQANLADRNVEYFYYLSRAALVKDERHLDKFDQVFGHVFKGLDLMADAVETQVPEEWLRSLAQLYLTEEEKAKIEALGGWEKIMEELRKRLEEQKGRHQGGKKWIGTGGTSPYGADGYNPAGVRIGQKTNRNNRAIKVWDKREYRDLDDKVELGTRNIKVALRRLRKFAREGAARRARPRRHHQGHRAQGLPRHPHAARAAKYREPAGVVAMPCIYLTHHRHALWPNPDEFMPERFLGKKPTPWEFFPFGGGTRFCLGAGFATYEMKVVLAQILSRTTLRLVQATDSCSSA